jgi:uncharacterized protein (TIGR02246 family)
MSINRKVVTLIAALAVVLLPLVLFGIGTGVSHSMESNAGITPVSTETPGAGIDKTLKEWAKAIKQGDSAALVSLVTKDGEFWTHGAPPVKGRDALKEAFDKFFTQFSAEQSFIEVERQVSGEWAFLRGLEINILKPRAGGEPTEYRQRAFSILRLEPDGRWRFARGMTNQGPIKKN